MKYFIKISFLFIFLLFFSNSFAQYIYIPIEQKIRNSKLIVEGEVIGKKFFKGTNGEIYTENIVKLHKIIKGDYRERQLSIITMGGIIDGHEVDWSHLLKLSQHEYGIFFLSPTTKPLPQKEYFNQKNVFDVYSESQGFYQIIKDKFDLRAISILDSYEHVEELYQKLGLINTIPDFIKVKDGKDDCLEYKIEPLDEHNSLISFGNKIRVGISVRSKKGQYKLYQSKVNVKYSSDFFGEYVVSSGNLTFTEEDLVTSKYNLEISDLSKSELSINLSAITDNFDLLETIDNNFRNIATIELVLKGWSNEIPFEIEYIEGNLNNYFIDRDGVIKEFECTQVTLGRACDIDIFGKVDGDDGVTPDIAAAGVQLTSENGVSGVVTISGSGFTNPEEGEKIPKNYRVKFETVEGGWIAPFEGDYLGWSDNEIRVKVPSFGYKNNSGNIIEDLNTEIACTGKVRVCEDTSVLGVLCPCCCDDKSEDDLYIPFSVRNTSQVREDNCIESVRFLLRDANESGGYTIFFGEEFGDDAAAVSAFKNALTTWRCETRVNFGLNEVDEFPGGTGNCLISFEDLGVGTTTTTRATTAVFGPDCGIQPSKEFGSIINFSIKFNKNIEWDGSGEADLESTALHEIGHAHLLLHTCNGEDKVMHPSKTIVVHDLHMDDRDGGEHISLLSSSSFDPECPIPETMILVDLLDCIVSSNNVNQNNFNYTIFPNPVRNKLYIHFESEYKDGLLILADRLGRIVLSRKLESNKQSSLDLSNITNGIYFLVFQNKTGEYYLLDKIQKN